MMKKVFYFIGAALYGVVASYLLWLVFYYLTPWLMSFGWLAVVLYWLFAFGAIAGLIGGLSSVLFAPLCKMVSYSQLAKVLPIIALLFSGYSSIAMSWQLDINYSFVKIIIASSLSLTALIVFVTLISLVFSSGKENK